MRLIFWIHPRGSETKKILFKEYMVQQELYSLEKTQFCIIVSV